MQHNKIKKVLMATIISIFSILLGTIFSITNADSFNLNGKQSIGKKIRLSTFMHQQDLYCVQFQKHAGGTYTVTNYVQIEGTKATSYNLDGTTKTKDANANAVLAYILGADGYGEKGEGPSGKYTARQAALWRIFNVWVEKSGKHLGVTFNSNGGNQYYSRGSQLLQDALKYTGKAAEVQSKVGKEIVASSNIVGKFNVKYTGEISSIVVKNTAGNEIKNGVTFYTDKDGKNKIEPTNIKSNQNFYVSANGETIGSVTVNVKADDVITAELWFIKNLDHAAQTGMIAKTGKKKSEASTTIKVKTSGELVIKKTDKETKKALQGAKFKFRISSAKDLWLGKNSKGKWIFNASYKNAYEAQTDKNGEVKLKGLPNGAYGVFETEPSKGYNLESQPNFKNGRVFIETAKISNDKKIVEINAINVKPQITIYKYDSELAQDKMIPANSMGGAVFKVYVGSTDKNGKISKDGKWLGKNKDNTWNYNSTFGKAATFKTVAGKGISVENIKAGTYVFCETETPDKNIYGIEHQDGYDKDLGFIVGPTAKITKDNISLSVKHINKKTNKKISISGYVFVDKAGVKADRDNRLSSNDEMVKGAVVELINKTTGKSVAQTRTDDKGYYIFKDAVIETELSNYYVKFDYTGTAYSSCKPIEFNASAEGSKAIINNIPEADKDFVGIATTYSGKESNIENKYGLSGLYKTLFKDNTLQHINLGLIDPNIPKYDNVMNIEYVRIEINGYTYNYYYGKEENKKYTAAPKVEWQGKQTYSRPIYPADIVYESKDKSKELKVYVGYRIDITNTETRNNLEQYKEVALHLTSLKNVFDKDRYELHDNKWNATGEGTATLKDLGGFKSIGSEKTETTKIEFSVKPNAIKDILSNPDGITEKFPTKAVSNGYHEYQRYEYYWKNKDLVREIAKHTTNSEEKTSEAPYLRFLMGDDRIVTGKVFEDTVVSTNGEKLGNGQYDDGEKLASGVKVELLLGKQDKEPATVYPKEYIVGKNGKNVEITNQHQAIATTDTNGAYTIAGIVPGDYYLRFTYGNGETVITKLGDKEIKAKDYKSTIVTQNVAKDALKNGEKVKDTKHTWYKNKDINSGKYAVAVDDLDVRSKVNKDQEKNQTAYTAKFSITVEDTEGDEMYLVSEDERNKYKGTSATEIRTYPGFNLGLIEAPKQDAEISKKLVNISLVNEGGNVVFNGNPANTQMPHVTDLSANKDKNGATFVRTEIENELIQGATLTLTYAITVTNTSDVNYATPEYQWYGENKTNEVTLQIDTLDQLDHTLKFLAEESSKEIKQTEQEDVYEKTKIGLYTSKNEARKTDNKKSSEVIQFVANRKLSQTDDDMEFINTALINKISTTVDNKESEQSYRIARIEVERERKAEAKITITPPTGADKISPVIYVSAGIVLLLALIGGITIIKKKVV